MSDTETNNDQQEGPLMSFTAQLLKAQSLIEDGPQQESSSGHHSNTAASGSDDNKSCPISQALVILEKLQEYVQTACIFSNNESLSDIQTSSLPLLAVEYHMAKAFLQLRTNSSTCRNSHVQRALGLFHLFLDRCDSIEGIFDDQVTAQYRSLPDVHDEEQEEEFSAATEGPGSNLPSRPFIPSVSRDEKIARYRQSKELKAKISKMNAQLEQRKRLDLQQHEELDGHDEDSLLRCMSLHELNDFALNAIEELYSCMTELQMLKMAVQFEKEQENRKHYRMSMDPSSSYSSRGVEDHLVESTTRRETAHFHKPSHMGKGMKLTQVLQDPMTGQLIFKKQEIKSQVFRPGWNQPTMSLEQLAEKEVREAKEREVKQQIAERQAKAGPRRYDELVKDGMEDNQDLVDASAKLDREWDDWKEDNPRGSGNKMGDRGDRNF